MVTEAEARRRERAAYGRGVTIMYIQKAVPTTIAASQAEDHAQSEVDRWYPKPKVRRPRVVRESGDYLVEWRIVAGGLEWRSQDYQAWQRVPAAGASDWWTITPERAQLWADLFATPEEEVEAE
jgi:hypothetical protein